MKIAGNSVERAQMMPLLYIDSDEAKREIKGEIVGVLQ